MRNRIVRILSLVVIIVSLAVIYGWIFEIDILKRIIPGAVTMKFSTALSFVFSGIILGSIVEKRYVSLAEIAISGSVLVVSLLMASLMISVSVGVKTGIEDLFIAESLEAVLTNVPGRPSIGTMLAFILISILGVLSLGDFLKGYKLRPILSTTVVIISTAALVGYLINLPVLYYLVDGVSTAMAIHTAILLLLLGTGFLIADEN